MKWINKIITSVLLVSVLSIVPFLAYADPLILRFGHDAGSLDPKASVARRFKSLLKERVGEDKILVKISSNKKLFNDNRALDAVLKGKTDITMSPLSSLKKYSDRFQIFDLPFIFSSSAAAQKFVQGEFGVRLLNSLKPNNLHGFGYLSNGMRQLSSKRLIVTPDDLEGLKIQISGSPVEKLWLQSTGAIPVKKPLSSVYALLKKGELDGQMNVWSNIYANKLFEQQDYIVESDHSFLGYVVIASEKFWLKVPENLQIELSKAMAEAIKYGNTVANEKAAADRQSIIDAGKAKVYKLSLDQRQAWIETMLPIWKKFESEIGEGLIQAAASQR